MVPTVILMRPSFADIIANADRLADARSRTTAPSLTRSTPRYRRGDLDHLRTRQHRADRVQPLLNAARPRFASGRAADQVAGQLGVLGPVESLTP